MNDLHLVLHGLAIKKHAGAAAVAGVIGLAEARVAELLQQAASAGRAVETQGAYMLSPAGRMIIESHYSKTFDQERQDGASEVVELYEQIGRLKMELEWLKKKAGEFER